MNIFLIIDGSGLYINNNIDRAYLDENLADKYVSKYNKALENKWTSTGRPTVTETLLARKLKIKITS